MSSDPVPYETHTTRDAREQLSRFLREFETAAESTVHFYGPHRRPVGAVVSADLATEMLEIMDDVAIADTVLQRLSSETPVSTSLDELMDLAGVDPELVRRARRRPRA